MDIIFTNTLDVPIEYSPRPASQFVPDWYKKMESYLGNEKKPDGAGMSNGTIKRCMPVFDVITAGYIITTHTDIWVSWKEIVFDDGTTQKNPWYEWASYDAIGFHPIEQAPEHPAKNDFVYPKWINTWGIQTPKGYSTLFISPTHRDNPFTILPGIVDTDTYVVPVNFPMVLTNSNFEGLIPAGTPIAQVIPIKRDSWEMLLGTNKNIDFVQKSLNLLQSKFFDRYKSLYRQKKEYK